MYKVVPTPSFARDVKRLKKKHYPMDDLKQVVDLLAEGGHEEMLRTRYYDHRLSSDSKWRGFRELHIDGKAGDWLLIYRYYQEDLVPSLVQTGSHKKLFGK